MKIFVVQRERLLTGASLELEVDSRHTIATVKATIQNITGILVEHQILVFGWRKLEDINTLEDYNIQRFSTLDFKTNHSTISPGTLGSKAANNLDLKEIEKNDTIKHKKDISNEEDDWESFSSTAKIQFEEELENKKLLFNKFKEEKRKSLGCIISVEAEIQADANYLDVDLWKLACTQKDIEATKSVVKRKQQEINSLEEKIRKDSHEKTKLETSINEKRTRRDDRRKEILDLNEKIELNGMNMKQLLSNQQVESIKAFLAESIAQKASLLQCPVCFEMACPPIYKCSREHLICSKCLPRMNDKCPTCRTWISGSDKKFRLAEDIFYDLQKMKEKLVNT